MTNTSQTVPQVVPTHLGLILDGNRRWAKARKLPTLAGHSRGYKKIKEIATYAFDQGIKYVSVFIFSTENWKRDQAEVSYLMNLAYKVATEDIVELHQKNVKILWLGRRDGVPDKVYQATLAAVEKTRHNTGGVLCICFNYGGHQEIADACRQLIDDGVKAEDVTPEAIAKRLYCPEVPPIDMLIRTSGEQRISNFMLWRVYYAELYFIQKHWPAFSKADLDEALNAFADRSRRFGGN